MWVIGVMFVTIKGDKIIELRAKGMSYKAIAKSIPCSLGTVYYFLTDGGREKVVQRNRKRRHTISLKIKSEYGAKCASCGYDKCIQALEFDHIYPEDKEFTISKKRDQMAPALKEAAKCILLCCRCHRERHAGLLDIGQFLPPDL